MYNIITEYNKLSERRYNNMEMRWLTADDYDELLAMLNTVFATKYGRDVDFLAEQPKMWV